jgi:hypothetical protein
MPWSKCEPVGPDGSHYRGLGKLPDPRLGVPLPVHCMVTARSALVAG